MADLSLTLQSRTSLQQRPTSEAKPLGEVMHPDFVEQGKNIPAAHISLRKKIDLKYIISKIKFYDDNTILPQKRFFFMNYLWRI